MVRQNKTKANTAFAKAEKKIFQAKGHFRKSRIITDPKKKSFYMTLCRNRLMEAGNLFKELSDTELENIIKAEAGRVSFLINYYIRLHYESDDLPLEIKLDNLRRKKILSKGLSGKLKPIEAEWLIQSLFKLCRIFFGQRKTISQPG